MNINPNRMQRINVTLHPSVLAVLEEGVVPKKRSALIQRLLCAHFGIPNPQEETISEEREQTSEIGLKTP